MRRQNKFTGTRRTKLKLETLEARRLMSVYADFNGDGFDDLAIGAPGEDGNSGMVHVLYGTGTGLTVTGTQRWTQGILGTDLSEGGDLFGSSLAAGDFNNDGFGDLAVGVPGEKVGTVLDAGLVHFILGSSSGLTNIGDYVLHQDTNRVRDFAELDDAFGQTLAAGDWDNDGFIDLAVGVPGQDVSGQANAGAVHIFYGGGAGIKPPGNQAFHLDSPGMSGAAVNSDAFGAALTAGDYNGDGRDDLAIGIPSADVDDLIGVAQNAGAVAVMYSSANGLSSAGNQLWTEASSGVSSTPGLDNNFGNALAAGDFNGDGRVDLAIGVMGEAVGVSPLAGAVHVLYGSPSGVTAVGEQFFTQSDAGGNSNLADFFAWSLTSADFSGDGRDDLAIGARGESDGLFGEVDFGAVNVMYGSGSGITKTGAFELTQEDMGTGDSSEDGDRFGEYLSAGDYDGNGRADLAVAAANEDIGTTVLGTGRVWTIYGLATGFTAAQSWGQDTAGMPDVSETGDKFGGGLDAGAGRSSDGNDSGRRDALVNGLAPFADRPAARETKPVTSVSNRVETVISLIATLDDEAPATTSITARSVRPAKISPVFAFELDLNDPLT